MHTGRLLFVGLSFLALPVVVSAALPSDTMGKLPSSSSIRRCYTGQASTYNSRCETDPRERAWGNKTSTGIPYNENEWTAAIQLKIASSERCGIGAGGVCYAAVQEPKGRAAILKITDNGPLAPGRIIDLNEKSMRYLSYEKSGNCSGLIHNVKVCLLNGNQSAYLGPVDEKDSAEWAKRVVGAPQGEPPPGVYKTGPFSGNPYSSSLFGPALSNLFGQSSGMQPPSQPLGAGSQLGQYFSPAGSVPLPLRQLFPLYSEKSTPTAGTGNTIADRLLDLIKSPSTGQGDRTVTITVGEKLKDAAVLDANVTTRVELVPLSERGIYPTTQTFSTQGITNPALPPVAPQAQSTVGAVLDSLKQTLQRIFDMLRGL